MTEERNEPMVWDEFHEGGGEIAAECGMEPIMLRLCVAQRHRINVPADRKPQAGLAQICPILLVGSRITAPPSNCLRLWVNNWACLQGSRSLFDLLLTYVSFASKVILDKIYNTYKSDLSDEVTYDKEEKNLVD